MAFNTFMQGLVTKSAAARGITREQALAEAQAKWAAQGQGAPVQAMPPAGAPTSMTTYLLLGGVALAAYWYLFRK